jgi:hypothetical protein
VSEHPLVRRRRWSLGERPPPPASETRAERAGARSPSRRAPPLSIGPLLRSGRALLHANRLLLTRERVSFRREGPPSRRRKPSIRGGPRPVC